MKDRLEHFIAENQAAFDSETPDIRVWAAIEQNLAKQKEQTPQQTTTVKRLFFPQIMRIAAAITLILGVGIVLGMYINRPKGMELSQISNEFAEAEQFYEREINSRQTKLVSLNYDTSVLDDLKQIDAVMEELKQELAKAPESSKEQIISNMIKNYKAKVEILERVLSATQTPSLKPININNNDKISI